MEGLLVEGWCLEKLTVGSVCEEQNVFWSAENVLQWAEIKKRKIV